MARSVPPQQISQHGLVDRRPFFGQRMLRWKWLPRSSIQPDLRPVLRPIAIRVRGGIRGQHGAVELFVGEFEPLGPLVVEVCLGALLEAEVFGGRWPRSRSGPQIVVAPVCKLRH